MDMPLALLNRRRRGSVLNPEILFSVPGSRGFFYDFSDYSTQFTDTAGTTAITGVGQSLARVNDKSGLGNHATQATAGSRPLTQVRPMGVTLRNLLTYSEAFDNAAWSKSAVGIAANSTVAPDGTSTADTCTPDTTTAAHLAFQTTTVAGSNVQSIYVKANGYTKVALREGQTGAYFAAFDLSGGGSVLFTSSATATITSVGDGWFRLAMVGTLTGATRLALYVLDPAYTTGSVIGSWAPNGTSGVFLWGAQVENGSTASTYQPTGPALINGEKRNLLTFTEQFNDAVWANSSPDVPTVAANTTETVAPDGSNTSDKITAATGGTSSHLRQFVSGSFSGVYTISVFVKAGNSTQSRLRLFDNGLGTVANALINWSGGSISSLTSVTGTASYQTVGDGWFRVRITTASLGSNASLLPAFYPDSSAGTGHVYLWGAQLELGPTPTAYQRVVTANEWYEPGFTSYRGLRFDGSDDFLQTAAIDFSNSDKMTVVAGVRKLSDAARGVLIELGNTAGINAFVLDAPGTIPASELYRFVSGGSTIAIAAAASASFAAPSTVVQTGIGNISGDSSTLRLNGTQVAQITTDQGTGNYGNHPVFIGRRGGATLPFNGVLTFLCVINRTLTAGELAQLEAFANSRTGAY